jgi:hypothetical protein
MGLRSAVSQVPISKWLSRGSFKNPKLDDALRDRLVRGIAELQAVAECLES